MLPVEPASDVVIFGAGPVGFASVMGAKVKGASRIIVVEPIPYRRDLALKLGATDVVDPNQSHDRTPYPDAPATGPFRDGLVEHLRDITRRRPTGSGQGQAEIGPHHVIEAVGGDRIKPRRLPQGPDPTGVTVLNQCWELGSSIGSIVTCSVGHPAMRLSRFRRHNGRTARSTIGPAQVERQRSARLSPLLQIDGDGTNQHESYR